MSDTQRLAELLDQATRTGTAVPQLSADAELDLAEAYRIQHAGILLREARGERVTGTKLGFTSKAKAEQMGVSDVIIGVLTDAMAVPDGGILDISRGVHPRVEPEVAFRVGREIDLADPAADLAAAVTHVAPALEIIDSRYRDFRFSLADVVADNTSASAYVLGPWTPFDGNSIDLADLAVDLSVDGSGVAAGSTADILGDPVAALPATQRMGAGYGHRIPADGVVLAGAATAAVPLQAGVEVTATVSGLGTVSFRTTGGRR